MGYDSITNVSIPTAVSNVKEFGKKKRVNRTAKLKQSKLDVRREQWLSQVKNKGRKEEINGVKMHSPDVREQNDDRPVMKLEINPEGIINHYSDSDSPSNSPISHTSSVFGSNRSNSPFTSSSSSSSGGCYSGSMAEEEEEEEEEDDGDNGCLDDWEAIADALAAADDLKTDNLESPEPPQLNSLTPPESEPLNATMVGQDGCFARAWRPDDVSRPQSLPNLLKQNSFPMNSDRLYGFTAIEFGFNKAGSPPSTCPICCEDLDLTDTCFLPCPCGYRLCLFCHKRILEDDGRCPGCRKEYDHRLKLGRSCSMIPRH